jgi:N-acetylneuraminate synthase
MRADDKVFIIAEAGVNHNGDIDNACRLIRAAKAAGVDAIKFQSFKTELLATRNLEKEAYQRERQDDSETQFEMLKRLELTEKDTEFLKKYSYGLELEFISTPYDYESVDLLERIGVTKYKIGSGEITDLPFLEYISNKGKPIILSTGASTIGEVKEAVDTILLHNSDLSLLHCTSSYPVELKHVNLNAMLTMMQQFNLPIGYSDHTTGLTVAAAAVALGARIIEKHFTLDKNLPGPDHKASLNPGELKKLVKTVRDVELAMGTSEKKPSDCETETIQKGRRSIITVRNLKKGEIIARDDLIIKRPSTGIAPKFINDVIGARLKRDIKEDSVLSFKDIEENIND